MSKEDKVLKAILHYTLSQVEQELDDFSLIGLRGVSAALHEIEKTVNDRIDIEIDKRLMKVKP